MAVTAELDFSVEKGYQIPDAALATHARVAECAEIRGISYRDAVRRLPSLHSLTQAPDGSQLSPPEARIIDPVLTTAARGYRNAEHVHPALFPRVETGSRGGQRIEFDRTAFRRVKGLRAPGAQTRRIQFGHEGEAVLLQQHRLEGMAPVENLEDAGRGPGIDLGARTVDGVLSLISLEREIDAAELLADESNYRAGHVKALAANARWDAAGSDPTADIVNAIEQVRSVIGRRAQTVLLGPQVFTTVCAHEKILQQIRYGGAAPAVMTEDLARLWRVQRVVIGDAVWVDEDDVTHDVWTNIVVVAYTAVGSLSRGEPSFGYGYNLRNTPMAEAPYLDRNRYSWIYPCVEEWSNEIVGPDAGFLIKDVLAP